MSKQTDLMLIVHSTTGGNFRPSGTVSFENELMCVVMVYEALFSPDERWVIPQSYKDEESSSLILAEASRCGMWELYSRLPSEEELPAGLREEGGSSMGMCSPVPPSECEGKWGDSLEAMMASML